MRSGREAGRGASGGAGRGASGGAGRGATGGTGRGETGAAALGLLLLLAALSGCGESPGGAGGGGSGGPGGGGAGGTAGDGGGGSGGFEGCPTGSRRVAADGSCAAVGWQLCPDGFVRDDTGWGCLPLLPGGDCPAGTRPSLGSATCLAVGPTGCAAGFEPDPSGWGCAAILPQASCAGGERQALGNTACVKLGDCTRPFPPADADLVVDPALAQEDATHLRSLAAAVAAAPADAVIAIEAGVYRERLQLRRPMRLVGRCAEQVIVEGPSGTGTGILVSGVGGVELSGLTVRGFDLGVEISGGAVVTLRELQVEQAGTSGVFVLDPRTSLTVERSVVRDLRGDQDGRFGQAFTVGLGARLSLSDSELAGAQDQAVYVLRGRSSAELTDVVIHDVRSRPSGELGHGLSAGETGTARLTRVSIRDVAAAGVAVGGARSLVELADVEIRRVVPGLATADKEIGAGVSADSGARLTGTNVTVVEAGIVGAYAFTPGSTVELDHSVLLRTGDPSRDFSAGVHVVEGASAILREVAVVEPHGYGLSVARAGAVLDAEGLLVRDPGAGLALLAGVGILVDAGATVRVRDAAVLRALGAGIYASEAGTTLDASRVLVSGTLAGAVDTGHAYGLGVAVLEGARARLAGSALLASIAGGAICQAGAGLELTDSVVAGVEATRDGEGGYGVVAMYGCPVTMTRGAILAATTAAAQADGTGSGLRLTEVSVAGVRPDAAGERARGLNVQRGATATLEQTALVGTRQVGLFAFGDFTSVLLRDSLISGTTATPDGSFGHGIEAVFQAAVQVEGSELRGSAGVGLMVAAAAATASATSFTGNAVALHVQDGTGLAEGPAPPAPAPLELTIDPGCAFVENRSRLGAGQLPLVDPLEPLAQ